MRIRPMTALCGMALVAAGALLPTQSVAATPVGPATPVASAADDIVVRQLATTSAQQQAVRAYWTPDRIAAIPTDPPSDRPPADGPDGAAWSGPGAVAATEGRLFFTDHGEDSSCTATVLNSANRSVVITGGHCVVGHDLLGEDGQWADNELFVPGYRDGAAPHGTFAATAGVAHATWVQNGEEGAYDQAFLVLGENEQGERAAEMPGAGGGQKIGYDRPGAQPVMEFGYPRGSAGEAHSGRPEFTGKRLAYCYGTGREDHGPADFPNPDGTWGIPCDMGGGASGGPRIAGFDTGTGVGTVIGLDTQGSFMDDQGESCALDNPGGLCTRYLIGPELTEALTKPLYERAEGLQP